MDNTDNPISKSLIMILMEIEGLQEDEYKEDRPSPYACELAVQVLRAVATELGAKFPYGIPSVGPNNSLRLHWTFQGGEVRMVFGENAGKRHYLYWESLHQHGVEYGMDAQSLAASLCRALQVEGKRFWFIRGYDDHDKSEDK